MAYFYLLIGLSLLGLLYLLLEPHLLDRDAFWLEKSNCHKMGEKEEKQHHFHEATCLRVLFFSDLHASWCFVSPQKIKEHLLDLADHVDLCIFGGDLSNGKRNKEQGLAILSLFHDILSQKSIPCYAVRGNHDKYLSKEDYKTVGFTLLQNEGEKGKTTSGKTYFIWGSDDPRFGPAVPPPEKVPAEKSALPILWVAHNPDQLLHAKAGKTHFFFSGHFHGGQIRLPFRIEFRLMRPERLCKEGIIRGSFERNQCAAFISRGMGCVLLPFRFLSLPELSLLYCKLEEEREREGIRIP